MAKGKTRCKWRDMIRKSYRKGKKRRRKTRGKKLRKSSVLNKVW